MERRHFLQTMTATIAAGSLAGCAVFGGDDVSQTIGAPTPQSGTLATPGEAGIRGMEVAMDELSEELDRDVELDLQDGQGSPEAARSVVQEMLDNNVPVVTGTFSSDASNALSSLAEQEQFPFLTGISGAVQITNEDDDYTFRLGGNTYQQCKATMEFFAERGVENVGVLAADYSFGQSVVDYMTEYASAYGQSIEYRSLVPLNTSDFVPELRNIDTDAIDALLYPFPGGNGPTLLKQTREQGLFEEVDTILGFNAHGAEVYKQALGEDVTGLYTWSVDLGSDRTRQASRKMLDRFDVRMDPMSLPNYDAVHLIGDAIDAAGGFEPSALRDEIQDTDYRAASGYEVNFNDAGDNAGYRMVIGQWQNVDGEIRNVPQYTTDVLSPQAAPQ